MAFRTITGNIKDVTGTETPGATIEVTPVSFVYGTTASEVVLADSFTVTADGSGDVSFTAHEGIYTGSVQTSKGAKRFNLVVDSEGPWTLGRLVGLASQFTPGLAALIFDAKDAAEDAKDAAEAAAAQAQAIAGLEGGVTTSSTDTTAGRLTKVGDFGIGNLPATTGSVSILSSFDTPSASGMYGIDTAAIGTRPPGASNFAFLLVERNAQTATKQTWCNSNGEVLAFRVGSGIDPFTWEPWKVIWHSSNATVDGDGFLVEASPVLRLYADRIEEPTTPIGATMQRLGPGHYALTGCPPLATRGWQMRGAATCTVDHAVWVGDTLHVLTAVDGVQGDVPEGRFVMLRFWEPAEEGDEPPSVDAISQAEFEALLLAAHKRHVSAAIDRHIEAQARAMQYNGAAHLASYVASGVAEWAAEAQAFVAWRDAVWQAALGLLADAQTSGDVPSVEDALAALPEWSE